MSPQLDAIQRFIIVTHRAIFEESPSPMKLQKLCYYAQGYLLAQGEELFAEDFEAWQHGPVLPELWRKYRGYEWRGVGEDIKFEEDEVRESLREEISDIVVAYGRYDGAALSTMTHREAPWKEARGTLSEDKGSDAIISKESLRQYFRTKIPAA